MTIPQHEIDKSMSEAQKLDQLKEKFQEVLRDKFNEDKFQEDFENGIHITARDITKYRKKDDDEFPPPPPPQPPQKTENFKNAGLNFQAHFEKGEYIARGSNGHIIKSKNLDDLNRQIAKTFKVHAMTNHKEAECTYRTSAKIGSDSYKQNTESFVRNFINEGVVVKGDLPNDPEFWKNLKENYLKNEKHQKSDWDRLTRFVPPEYMQEMKQEKKNQQQQLFSPAMRQRLRALGRI